MNKKAPSKVLVLACWTRQYYALFRALFCGLF